MPGLGVVKACAHEMREFKPISRDANGGRRDDGSAACRPFLRASRDQRTVWGRAAPEGHRQIERDINPLGDWVSRIRGREVGSPLECCRADTEGVLLAPPDPVGE